MRRPPAVARRMERARRAAAAARTESGLPAAKDVFPRSDGSTIVLSEAQHEIALERAKVAREFERLAGLLEELDEELKYALGDAELGLFRGQAVLRWQMAEQERVSVTLLRFRFPEVVPQVLKTVSFRRFYCTPRRDETEAPKGHGGSPPVSDEEMLDRVHVFLEAQPEPVAGTVVLKRVYGKESRVKAALEAGVALGRFLSTGGARPRFYLPRLDV